MKYGKGEFYFDYRLSQLRDTTSPHKFVDLTVGESDAIQYLLEHDVYEVQEDST